MGVFLSNDRGMTLAEVLISVMLIAVVVVSLIIAATQSSIFSRRIDMTYVATNMAQRRVDLLKRLDFEQVPLAEETDVRVNMDGNIDPNGQYVRTTEVTTDYDGSPNLIKVKISVKKVKVNLDGTIYDAEGQMTVLGQPIVMETLFADVE